MFKGASARERLFSVLNWIVSLVLAAFLIGLGSLVIGDLPKVADPVTVDQFVDTGGLARNEQSRASLRNQEAAARSRLMELDAAHSAAENAYSSAKDTFDNWVLTRAATADTAQDPEVLARTRNLDRLKAAEQTALSEAETARRELAKITRSISANRAEEVRLREAALPRYERASFLQELKVFALRLALTLPLLAVAAWLLLKRRGGDYWPMKRGFILFAGFAFFVELVPYLPDYGGYVRYGVGILITLIVGHYLIKNMRAYLKAREDDEARAEKERVRSIAYDEALKKKAAYACPGCDRTLPTNDGMPVDYCVHCGMHLFNRCPSCSTRKFAFFRYCMTCGTPAAVEAASGPAQ